MKFRSYTYHMVSLLAAFTVLTLSAIPCYGSQAETLYDPDGYVYDVITGSDTCIFYGTNRAYDRGYFLKINGVEYNAANLTISGRNIIGTTETLSGLWVTRKLYVPASKDGSLGNFGRWYDSLYNPTSSPITVHVEYFSNLGSDDDTTVTGTDDGDNILELNDQWIATDDADGVNDPSLAHIIYQAGADETIDYIELYGDVYGTDRLAWRFDSVTVDPGQTAAFLTFAVQEDDRTSSFIEATGIIASLESGDLSSVALLGLSVSEYVDLVNLSIIPPDELQITPSEDYISIGDEGGPFDPCSMVFTLLNTGSSVLSWTVDPNVNWLDVVISNDGNLPPDTNMPVTVSLNAYANILPQGIHTGPVSFVNQTTGTVQKRNVKLMIGIRRVLVYTQYADMYPEGEYDSIIKAIDSTGSNFSITNLTDYTQLSSMLPMHQILLIPDQEYSNLTELFDIGLTWAPVLQDFVNGGGAVIQCDTGQRYGILTGAGLMNITTSSDFSRQPVDVVILDDPIVKGVSNPYTASRYSSYYYTVEGEVIVERVGYGPVVIHKEMQGGHIVLIGHDYHESNPDQDQIVGNAVLYLPLLTDDLWVSPSTGLDFGGNEGGPFTPTSRSYTITNVGDNLLEWTAAITQPWLSVQPNSGTLDPKGSIDDGDSQLIVVTITADANGLPPGDFNDVITFTNTTSGYNEIRVVRLQIIPVPPEIQVFDGVPPIDDLNMPFGDLIIGQSSSPPKTIDIWNMSPDNDLIISEISGPQALYTVFFDDFQNTMLDPNRWTDTSSVPTIDDVGLGEPSAPYSLRLNGDPNGRDAVESRAIDLSGLSGLVVRYWWQRTGGGEHPETGEDLILEYWNGAGWVELERQLGGGANMSNYLESLVPLPPAAYHQNFRLRIRSIGGGGTYDDWFVDNISIQPVFRLEGVPDLPIVIPSAGNVIFDVIFAPIEVKEYQAMVVIKSNDEDEPQVGVQLQGSGIPDYLVVDQKENFEFSGLLGGPFLPSSTPYYLTNNGPIDIDWSIGLNVPWLSANPINGSIKPGESATIVVFPGSQANNMSTGIHLGQLIFTNITFNTVSNRTVILNVQAEPKVWVRPQAFNVTIPSGEIQSDILTIGNAGGGVLEFVLGSRSMSFVPASEGESGTSSAEKINDVNVSSQSEPETAWQLDLPYAEGELLVRFAPQGDVCEPGVNKANILMSTLGSASIEKEYSIVPGLCLIRIPENMTVEEGIEVLGESEDVLYVEPNYEFKVLSVIPNDPLFNQLWNMHNTGQAGGTNDADIDAPEAWDLTAGGGSEVIVAVIDTGIDYLHPDLAANMWINQAEFTGASGVDDDGNGYVDDIHGYDFAYNDGDPMDDIGHGSHVSGIIGAVGNNGVGVAGVCWNVNVKIMAVKFFNSSGSGFSSNAIGCIQYAVLMGAKVLSNSYGGDGYSSPLEDAINAAGDAGVLFIGSAGNGWGLNNDVSPHYPSGYDQDNIIAVLSTNQHDQLSIHSSYGLTSVDIGAPGGDPDIQILSCYFFRGYYSMYGTSMAVPHVSGACALVWSMNPGLSHLDVKDIIIRTADPLPTLNGFCASGGRLNLHSAILQVEAEASWIDIMPEAGSVLPGGVNDVSVIFDASGPVGTYEGQIIINSDDPYVPEIIIPVTMTIEQVDYFTELFHFEYPFDPCDSNCNDMANRTLTLMPDGSGSYYQACSSEATSFPVDPNGGTNIPLKDDDYVPIDLGGEQIDFYGTNYDTIYIGSNGYITFLSGDAGFLETFENHFDLPRISVLFDDLDPSVGGTISWEQLDDRIVVTYENISEFSLSNSNSFQVEMFYNGKIRITYLEIAAGDGIVGLSEGYGLPLYYVESDLSEHYVLGDLDDDCDADFDDYAVLAFDWHTEGCDPGNDWCSGIDLNKDGRIDIYDLAKFCPHWLECTGPRYP